MIYFSNQELYDYDDVTKLQSDRCRVPEPRLEELMQLLHPLLLTLLLSQLLRREEGEETGNLWDITFISGEKARISVPEGQQANGLRFKYYFDAQYVDIRLVS